jgi:hypothetical protein
MPIIASGSTLDPIATLIPDPNVDYGELAAAHHALAEAAALDMQRLAAELLALREREAKGNHYVSRLLTGDEDVAAANMLLRAIGDDIQAVSLELDQAARTCWNACRNAYVATAMMRKSSPNASRNAQDAPGRTQQSKMGQTTPRASQRLLQAVIAESPLIHWQLLVGEWVAPGSWPPSDEEMYVPERWQCGPWETEELEALVARKRR